MNFFKLKHLKLKWEKRHENISKMEYFKLVKSELKNESTYSFLFSIFKNKRVNPAWYNFNLL